MGNKPVILDCLGGDRAIEANVDGVAQIIRKTSGGLSLILVGPEDQLRHELTKRGLKHLPSTVTFEHCDSQFDMDRPAQEVLKMRGCTIFRALQLLKEGQGSSVVSAGHTGAVFMAAVSVLGRHDRILRPGLGVVYPTVRGPTLLLDGGANVDCRPIHLAQFGAMGAIYYAFAYKKERVTVGLLSNGEESSKGSRAVKDAFDLLSQAQVPRMDFKGMVDASQVFINPPEVLISDGFIGNIVVKTTESLVERFRIELKRYYVQSSWVNKLGMWISRNNWRALKKGLDFREVGGAPLLGLKGSIFVCHGRSDGAAIAQCILQSHAMDFNWYQNLLGQALAAIPESNAK